MTIGIYHIVAHHESLISLSCDDAASAARSNYVTYVSRAARWFRSIRHTSIVAVLAAGSLSACNPVTLDDAERRPPDVFDRIRSIDLLPQSPAAQEPNANVADARQDAVYTGSNVTTLASADTRASKNSVGGGGGPDGYELNFENTPITTVAKVVIGDILGVGYTIDPRVQGTITLASGRPVPKADVLFVLENALRVSNVVLVRETTGYRLIPLGEAAGAGNVDGDPARAEPGYGVSVVPLQYVSAQTLIKLLDSFATRPGSVRADTARNMLLIQGSGAERRTAIETVLSFDAEWMQGQSIGIFPVRNTTPDPLVTELEKIVDSSEGGLGQNLIKFQSIGRMNSILVVARKPGLLKTAATWIKRLDNGESNVSVRVYRIRYGEARQMARVLNDMFNIGGSNGSEPPLNQIAPGSGVLATSSGDQVASSGQFGAGFGSPANSSTRVRQQLGITPPTQRGAGVDLATAPPTGGPSGALSVGSSVGGSAPLLTGVRITPDVVNNSLLVYASRENYRIIERAIQQIDRPQMQVAIDATIAEVTLNNDLNYGVQFFLTSHDLGLRPDKGSALNSAATQPPTVDASGVANAFLNRAFPGFNFLVGPEAQPRVILDALHAVTSVKVLSNPSLVVIDNQPAILQVGDQVPISTGSATVLTANNTIVNTIDYRDTGIILRVIPRVNVNGIVRLDIEQEISNVAPTSSTTTTLTPTVSQRRVKSSVSIASGQTVLLAGLISERQNRGSNGIPLLDQLPQPIGDLFATSRTNGLARTELIIFIRPQIIRDGVDAHFVAEEMRAKLRGDAGANAPIGPLTTKLR
jgi:general secretion pathway protein D